MASARDPADLINASLVRIGWKQQIGNLYDGSAAATQALSIYGQTRDQMLRESTWDFAQRSLNLTLLKSAPVGGYIPPNGWDPTNFPPQPWRFEYEYPEDCLKVRTIKAQQLFVPNFDPQANRYSVASDNAYVPHKRVLLSNVESAIMVYTGRVTDPSLWAVDFTESFIDKLGELLGPALTGLQPAQMQAVQGARETEKAKMEQG